MPRDLPRVYQRLDVNRVCMFAAVGLGLGLAGVSPCNCPASGFHIVLPLYVHCLQDDVMIFVWLACRSGRSAR